jgi:hypothetical protein
MDEPSMSVVEVKEGGSGALFNRNRLHEKRMTFIWGTPPINELNRK